MAGPLTGLKVLDFSTLLPGPYATLVLADMGAEVLRIVSGSRPDLVELMPPFLPGTKIASSVAWLGRGKRSMTLNLKDERGIKIIHQLISDYDIIIEQFRPGVMKKLGLDYPSLKEVNPSIIYGSLTGYGQSGPQYMRAGHDINYIARSGLMSYSGRKESGPSLTGMQIADVASGANNMIIGILAAVLHRKNTGQGQYIDISMMDGVVAFNALSGAGVLAGGEEPGIEGIILNGGSLYDFYETKDGKYISFGGLEPQFFSAFCKAVDCPELIDGGVMPKDIKSAKEKVSQIFKSRNRDEWADVFKDVDACVEPVLTLSEAFDDSHVKERGLIVELQTPDGGTVKQVATPIKFSETKPEYGKAGLPGGTETKEVLLETGYSDADIDEFKKTGLFD